MKEALMTLSEEQILFICKECSVTRDELMSMDDDAVYDAVYETMCDIEISETMDNSGEDDSKRCSLASDIVTALGRSIQGSYEVE